MLGQIDIHKLNIIARDAGAAIMKVYSQPFEVGAK